MGGVAFPSPALTLAEVNNNATTSCVTLVLKVGTKNISFYEFAIHQMALQFRTKALFAS